MSIGGANSVGPFPVQTKAATTGRSGISIVVHSYSNRYFVVIGEGDSQSIGTVLQVVKHQQTSGFDIGPSSTVYDINIRFGPETPELLLAARIIASRVNFDKPVLLGLALRNFNKDIFGEISEELEKILKSITH